MESFFDTHGGVRVRNYLKMRPADYFEKHVWLGGSLMKRYEAEMRHEIGIDKLMWGADYPHLEGAAPVHRQILRYIFGGHARGRRAQDAGRERRRISGASTQRSFRKWRTGSDRRSPTWPSPWRSLRHRGHVQLESGPSGAAGGRRVGPARRTMWREPSVCRHTTYTGDGGFFGSGPPFTGHRRHRHSSASIGARPAVPSRRRR